MFLHPQIPDSQILSKPYINGNIIKSPIQLLLLFKNETKPQLLILSLNTINKHSFAALMWREIFITSHLLPEGHKLPVQVFS